MSGRSPAYMPRRERRGRLPPGNFLHQPAASTHIPKSKKCCRKSRRKGWASSTKACPAACRINRNLPGASSPSLNLSLVRKLDLMARSDSGSLGSAGGHSEVLAFEDAGAGAARERSSSPPMQLRKTAGARVLTGTDHNNPGPAAGPSPSTAGPRSGALCQIPETLWMAVGKTQVPSQKGTEVRVHHPCLVIVIRKNSTVVSFF